jgi:hypothetical protein
MGTCGRNSASRRKDNEPEMVRYRARAPLASGKWRSGPEPALVYAQSLDIMTTWAGVLLLIFHPRHLGLFGPELATSSTSSSGICSSTVGS